MEKENIIIRMEKENIRQGENCNEDHIQQREEVADGGIPSSHDGKEGEGKVEGQAAPCANSPSGHLASKPPAKASAGTNADNGNVNLVRRYAAVLPFSLLSPGITIHCCTSPTHPFCARTNDCCAFYLRTLFFARAQTMRQRRATRVFRV